MIMFVFFMVVVLSFTALAFALWLTNMQRQMDKLQGDVRYLKWRLEGECQPAKQSSEASSSPPPSSPDSCGLSADPIERVRQECPGCDS